VRHSCKCIEPSRILTEDEIDEEVKKAKTFEPPLKTFLDRDDLGRKMHPPNSIVEKSLTQTLYAGTVLT